MKLGRRHTSRLSGGATVETGLPRDRNRGYEEEKTGFTGADARAALVGSYSKSMKKKRGFGSKKSY